LLLAACSGINGTGVRARTVAAPGIDGRAWSSESTRPAARGNEFVGHADRPGPQDGVTLDDIRNHVRNASAMIIDARVAGDFVLGHVHGALNMPPGQEDTNMDELWQRVAPSGLIIVYCNGPRCNSSDLVREYLVAQGFTNVRVFKPGWKAIAAVRELW
jgi:rhodanese-related sulfurtransferase